MGVRGRRLVPVAVAAAVLLAGGCSASHGSGASSDRAAPAVARAGAPEKAPGAGGGAAPAVAGDKGTAGQGSTAVAAPRLIAYKAQLSVRVTTVEGARTRALALVDTAGGYVAGEDRSAGRDGVADGTTLTLKVPSAEHRKTLDALAALGTTLALTSSADDVTQQVADVDSRLKSQQASVDRVRALMAEAKSLSDVVSLESELSRREADLEALQRQQQELAGRTSLSTITLQLVAEHTEAVVAPAHEKGFWASVGGALAAGWHGLVATVRVVLMVLAGAAPFLLVLSPLGWMLWRLRRRRSAAPRTTATAPDPWASGGSAGETAPDRT
ncbi:hypothetical protein GCM10010440_19220 [Kitasatospora cinereorecta]